MGQVREADKITGVTVLRLPQSLRHDADWVDRQRQPVFELSSSGGEGTERVIYRAHIDAPGLAIKTAGNVFGVELEKVFELSPNGNGGWNATVIHTFTGAPKDGSVPFGTPVFDKAGNLYGTTNEGGASNLGT